MINPIKLIRVAIAGLAMLSLLASAGMATDDAQVQEYVLWVGANAPGRADHEANIIRQALQRTADDYGPFKLIVSSETSISKHWRQLLAQGERMQIAPTSLMDFPPGEITLIPVPIAGGKLGYRNLIVSKQRLAEFRKVKSAAHLSHYTAGQGSSWFDTWVYEANNLPIIGAPELSDLLIMLAQGKIDYLPLSVDETPDILAAHPKLARDLVVVPDLFIYYPLSSFPVVSNRHPELIERLRIGLEAMHADGSIGETGRDAISQETLANCSVIALENPSRLLPLL
ncbi:transporter substrate-binding domain-containing protein [Gilvimarinus agarilyticus]|uniref:transporter substrate-binding domain-containing protein n=1 Tax=unclassified Gilvimarinus TaxID=2642066 RepID=UPI001C08D261|nr:MULTISPECIES: transporter substrate-binding domain-containing protein [unclassified Gilvimarinus]MBU2885270.1 transporter substrate-binding domain-containing protein [Gilvimarinus agarilyticus]MDO6570167.1 transporter substrate-binding domain-containing protein [Gilvimarinus sp. 2_MG-2023]MDO6748334.1 transporter substrate-binding domain-containing protein [Gilvimarinus sp. 1_MG-2023]